jgi:hypothetical protein
VKRFYDKVKMGPGCWEWTAAKLPKGYGKFGAGSGRRGWVLAHRFSYQLHYNVDPGEMLVCHKCDNPSCVNPDHLFLGTNSDNQQDSTAKGRKYTGDHKGEKNRAIVTEEDVKKIRAECNGKKENRKQLAEKYGLSDSGIQKIIYRRTWKHV